MSRPLRIEFAGAVYHVTARGDRREFIFEDDQDRVRLLDILAQGLERYDAKALTYCLMGNHYHFVLQTGGANLSRLMRHINGVYTQAYNRRHGLVGHLLQGRFKAVLVDSDSYLMEVCRYVELNPVRAGIVAAPGEWAWSSYRAHTGVVASPEWLDTQGLHGFLLGRRALSPSDGQQAAAMYAGLVAAGRDVKLWDTALRQQIFLGSEAFVERMQEQATPRRREAAEVPSAQRIRGMALNRVALLQRLQAGADDDAELARCYRLGGLTMADIAQAIGMSVATVSRRIARAERVPRSQAPERERRGD